MFIPPGDRVFVVGELDINMFEATILSPSLFMAAFCLAKGCVRYCDCMFIILGDHVFVVGELHVNVFLEATILSSASANSSFLPPLMLTAFCFVIVTVCLLF